MDLFFSAMNRMLDNVEARMSGPAHLDKTSDEYYAAETEVTEERADWADSQWECLP